MKKSSLERFSDWVNERWPLKNVLQWGLHEKIPGGTRFSYALGSASLFLFIILVLTGVWQMFFYVPTVDYAYASVNYLSMDVAFGWLIHGFHYWGAHAFTIVVGLHMLRVFVWGAYKKPRELVWLTGVFLLLLAAGFMFTGPILPWDKKGYWAGKVGLAIAGSVPFVGTWIQELLQGANKLGQIALTRFFVIHVAILPFFTAMFVLFHLVAFRMFGSIGPWDEKKRKQKAGEFWPEQLFKDALVALFLLVLLIVLTVYFPPEKSGMADPMDTRYIPKPEWNFLFLYEVLKYFSGPLEVIGVVGIPVLIILMFVSLPFIDTSPERNPAKRIFVMFCAGVFIVFVLGMTAVGFLSGPIPSEYDEEKMRSIATIKQSMNKESHTQDIGGVRLPGVRPAAWYDSSMSGKQLFTALGCIQCHSISGAPNGKQGPDLLMVLNSNVSREWLWIQLVAPEKHNPYTVMPPYAHVSDVNLNAVIDFLQSLATKKPPEFQETPVTPSAKGDPKFGRELFKAEGCTQCHTIKGEHSDKIGPDLMMITGEKTSTEWLRIQLMNPRRHNPNTPMPSYNKLGPNKINALVAFLQQMSKQSGNTPAPAKVQPKKQQAQPKQEIKAQAKGSTNELEDTELPQDTAQPGAAQTTGPLQAMHIVGNREHGKILFEQNCLTCHGPDGKMVTPDFPVPPRGVPGLNPIRKELYSKEVTEFLRNIDPFIQHGMPNPTDGPDMPAFGENRIITQAQIADIEAYVLKLNNVDRTQILNPGIEPKTFFYAILGISFVILLICYIYWYKTEE